MEVDYWHAVINTSTLFKALKQNNLNKLLEVKAAKAPRFLNSSNKLLCHQVQKFFFYFFLFKDPCPKTLVQCFVHSFRRHESDKKQLPGAIWIIYQNLHLVLLTAVGS